MLTRAVNLFSISDQFLSFFFFFFESKNQSWPDSRGTRRGRGKEEQVYRVRCLNKGSERKQHLQARALFFFSFFLFFFSDDTSRGSVDLSPLSSSLVTALCEFRVYIYVSPFFFSPLVLLLPFFIYGVISDGVSMKDGCLDFDARVIGRWSSMVSDQALFEFSI